MEKKKKLRIRILCFVGLFFCILMFFIEIKNYTNYALTVLVLIFWPLQQIVGFALGLPMWIRGGDVPNTKKERLSRVIVLAFAILVLFFLVKHLFSGEV